MSDQRRAPRSVADPDREPHGQSARKNARLQAEREHRETARTAFLDRVAGVGGEAIATIDAGVDSAKKYVSDPRVQRGMTRVARLAGPTGSTLSAYEARRQYEGDVANGMPADEAFVKATGGFAGGEIGGKLGMAGGAIVIGGLGGVMTGGLAAPGGAIAGGIAGGLKGQDEGEKLGQRLVEPYRGAKDWVKGVARPLYDPMYLYETMTRRY